MRTSTAEADARAEKYTIGLALGGGAELGLAHIGVLKTLEENGFPIRYLAGSSAGALVASFYAAGAPVALMERIAHRMNWRMLQRMTLPLLALSTNEPLKRFLERTLPVRSFDALKMPLRLVTTDLLTGEMVVFQGGPGLRSRRLVNDPDVVFEQGDLIEAIRASCARPVINRPVEIGGRLLVDGCLTNNVPALLVRDMGADVVVAVDLTARRRRASPPSSILSYAIQCQAINIHWALKSRHLAADVVIRPDFSGLRQTDFQAAGEIIRAGEMAATAAVPAIRSICDSRQSPADRSS